MLKKYNKFLGYEKVDILYTVSLREDFVSQLDGISKIEFTAEEGDQVDVEDLVGLVHTLNQGTIEIVSPIKGIIAEFNNLAVSDPSIVMLDPLDGWLFKVESLDEEGDLDLYSGSDEDEEDSF